MDPIIINKIIIFNDLYKKKRNHTRNMLFIVNALTAQTNDQNKFFCDVCEIIVEGVYEVVEDPTNIHEVEAFLE